MILHLPRFPDSRTPAGWRQSFCGFFFPPERFMSSDVNLPARYSLCDRCAASQRKQERERDR